MVVILFAPFRRGEKRTLAWFGQVEYVVDGPGNNNKYPGQPI